MGRVLGNAALIVGLTICALTACTQQPAPTEVWIDVRSTEEYGSGHRSDAVNIPHTDIGKRIGDLDLQKDQPIYLYCRSGRRAEMAKKTLDGLGYTRVRNVETLEAALARQTEND